MSHWYAKDGTPHYEVESKSGSMRDATLRDARKHGWVPSVSTVWKDVVAAPGLNRYYQEQLFDTVVSNSPLANETDGDYKKRMFAVSKEAALKAAERGTYFHNLLEQQMVTGSCNTEDLNEQQIVRATMNTLKEVCGDDKWMVEKSFAHPSGYGGKIDAHSDNWVVDFKTKEMDEGAKPDLYDSYGVQLAAYNHGLGGERRLLNVFVSVSSPGYVVTHEWEERERLLGMFEAALKLWQLSKRYNPEWQA